MIRTGVTAWFLGLDLGQQRGHSALATLQLQWHDRGKDPVTFQHRWHPELVIRATEQFRHGLGYLTYINTVDERLRQIAARHPGACSPLALGAEVYLAVDAGGPGMPVIEEFRRSNLVLNLRPSWITAGNKANNKPDGSTSVPRRELITTLALLIEHGRIVAPRGLNGRDLLRNEMLALRSGTTQPATSTQNDDIVIALSLATWQAARAVPALLTNKPVPANEYRRLL